MPRAKVKVISESSTGLNERISINGKSYTNTQAYDRAIKNKVEGYHGVKTSKGTKYLRSNPDKSKSNNIEK